MRAALLVILIALAGPAVAQQDRTKTLADIKQELTVLNVEIAKLKRELSTTGGVEGTLAQAGVLQRVDAMEAEMQRLTAATEELTHRVDQVVADGTNRIGDLQFRLCELEKGCDPAKLGDTPTLGGGKLPEVASAAPAPASAPADTVSGMTAPAAGGVELAVGEKDDFDKAKAAFDQGDYEKSVGMLKAFTETYPGSPLAGLAHLMRGEALQKMGMTSSAARAYLESYSGAPNDASAPEALLKLGLALGGLGQSSEACITLNEVTVRFPGSDASTEAQSARANMGCS